MSTKVPIVNPGNVIRTYRPAQGLGTFVRAASGRALVGAGEHIGTRGSVAPASLCGRERAQDQVHPGEGSA